MCGATIDPAMLASVSTTCKSLVGIGVPTAAATGAAARPTGIVDGVAAAAVAGVLGALL